MVKIFTLKVLIFSHFLAFLFTPFLSFTQNNSVLEPAGNKYHKEDTVSILIIPYNPRYYLSDSDRQIAEASNKSVLAIRETFRMSLDNSLMKQFNAKFLTHSVLSDTTVQAEIDLKRIYNEQVLNYEQSPSYKKGKKSGRKKSEKKERGIGIDNSSIATDNSFMDDQFMNVTFSNDELLSELAARYENDYFLFLNQFEIRIDYTDCLDLSKKIYNRKLKIHYSIYDKNGRYLTGDYVKIVFPSNTNNINEIISRNFYQIARQLAEVL
ncbi:MAG: hypothetical protein ACR2GN_05085 [Bacteroidia bacterium]